jgi:hypothetical protein
MRTEKIIGLLLIIGAILLFVPYTILAILFDYPQILRNDTGLILTAFNNGGTPLIIVWWLFAIVGLPILGAYVLIGQKLENKLNFIRLATTLAVISAIVQIIGLMRWTFVVPILAKTYVSTQNETVKEICKIVFQAVHQYGGVVLGEHIGQLFTIAWVVMITSAFKILKLMPPWIIWLGYISAFIYLIAQAELFATVIPNFPVWDLAGLIGSTLWLIWMILIGVKFLKIEIK